MEEFSKIKAERDALREEVKDLRMQIDILKKVQALVLKEERKASRGKSASSKG